MLKKKAGFGLLMIVLLSCASLIHSEEAYKSLAGSLREEISLRGEWDFMKVEGDLTYPPEGTWEKIKIPPRWTSGAGRDVSTIYRKYWYHRLFTIPDDAQGKRIKIKFMAVFYDARVYVNGKYAGSHFGGFTPFVIDITDLVKTGETNELYVGVRDWTSASTKEVELIDGVEPSHNQIGKTSAAFSFIAPIGSHPATGPDGIWQDVLLLVRPKVYMEDIFVMTSFRNKDIRLQITLRNEDSVSHTVKIENSVSDKEGIAKQLKERAVTIRPDSEATIEIKEGWTHPKLWDLKTPHLYYLSTTIKEKDKTVDQETTRFGFREIWTEGTKIFLNGIPLKLFGTAHGDLEGAYGIPYTYESMYKLLKRKKEVGYRAYRLHTRPWPPAALVAADEIGILMVNEAALHVGSEFYKMEDPRFWENYYQHLREFVLRDRNHPSLVIWSLTNELLAFYPGYKKYEVGLPKAAKIVRGLDPTRLITYNADLDPGGTADIIDLHYPHAEPYQQDFHLLPEIAYFLDDEFSYYQFGRWQWKRNKPLSVGEYGMGFNAVGLNAFSVLGGDKIFAGSRETVTRVFTEYIRFLTEAYRYSGVSGPYTHTYNFESHGKGADTFSEDYEITEKGGFFKPLYLQFKEHDTHFYSNQKVKRTLFVYNDLIEPEPAALTLRWTARIEGRILQEGQEKFTLKPDEKKACFLELNMPEVKDRTEIDFIAQVYKGKDLGFETKRKFWVFPEMGQISLKRPVGLYDKEGMTQKMFKNLGVRYQKIDNLSKLPPNIQIIVIGANSLGKEVDSNISLLNEFVRKGGRVICLEQGGAGGKFPFSLSAGPHAINIAFGRISEHPVLSGLNDEDLKFWAPDNRVARHTFRIPFKGNFKAVIDAGSIDGLEWSPLIEFPYGKGFYLFSQLLLTEKMNTHPAAGILFRNLLRYAQDAPVYKPARTALLTGEPLREKLDALRLVYESLEGKLSRTPLKDYDLLIIDGDNSVWGEVKRNKSKIKKFAQAGGKVVFHNTSPRETGLLKEILGLDIKIDDAAMHSPKEALGKIALDPVTAGFSNYDLYWATKIWEGAEKSLVRAKHYLSLPSEPKVKVLIPGELIKVSSGKGFFLLDQILWENPGPYKIKGNRIASKLLTNLGATLEISLPKTVKSVKVSEVSYSPHKPSEGPYKVDSEGFIREWLLCGPFPNPGVGQDVMTMEGYDKDYIGEENINPRKGMKHSVIFPFFSKWMEGEALLEWKKYSYADKNIDLMRLTYEDLGILKPEYTVAYAAGYIYSPEERTCFIALGSDDGFKVWLNHKLIAGSPRHRGATPDSDIFPVTLKKGYNLLLLKVDQSIGGWNFYLRFLDDKKYPITKHTVWF